MVDVAPLQGGSLEKSLKRPQLGRQHTRSMLELIPPKERKGLLQFALVPFDPDSNATAVWELTGLIMLFLVILVVPLDIVMSLANHAVVEQNATGAVLFAEAGGGDDALLMSTTESLSYQWDRLMNADNIAFSPTFWYVSDMLIDIFFMLDLCKTFATGFTREDGAVEMRWRAVARDFILHRTFTNRFFFGFISSFPFDKVLGGLLPFNNSAAKLLKISKIFKIAKLLRV